MAFSGVQRVLKFVKYLPRHGWHPTVLTIDPAGYYQFDDSLEAELDGLGIEVHRTSSNDPTRLFGKKKQVEMPSERKRKLASLVSQTFFIPDNKIGWKRAAVKRGLELMREGEFHAIFSSAPPYTTHLVGTELNRRTDVPLVTDFRDDWVENPLHFYATPWHRSRHRSLERDVIKKSAAVTTINRHIHDRIIVRNLGPEGYHKVSMIPQGYDAADFVPDHAGADPKQLRFTYAGIFYGHRSPEYFLTGLAKFLNRRSGTKEVVKAEFVGLLPERERQRISDLGLDAVVDYKGYLPHRESVARLQAADVLWLTIADRRGHESISTGKLYEYMGARKPILGLVPEGAAADTLGRYGAAVVVPPTDPDAISAALESLYDAWRSSNLPKPDEEFVRSFDRSTLAGALARVLLSTVHADSVL